MVDVGRETRIRIWIVEWLCQQNRVDVLVSCVGPGGTCQVLLERRADQAPERHAAGPCELGGPPLQVGR
jgi:hypothetical protein